MNTPSAQPPIRVFNGVGLPPVPRRMPDRPVRRVRSQTQRRPWRAGAASLELVLVTAVMLPLAILMLILGVTMCRYVFSALSGLLLMPFL